MNRLKIVLLAIIFFSGLFIRLYKLDQVPPSLNWDEVAAGYNAFTIAKWGQDEWGNKFPLVFTSFRDDKHPVHIYMTAPFVGIFGLSDFTARFPAALFSSFSIILIFLLAKKLFKGDIPAFFAAFFLSISPYHIHFSRGLWEIDFALFFFLLGLTLFFYGLGKTKLLYFAFASFGLSLYAYHSSKIVVIPLVFLLIVFYFKKLKSKGLHFILGLSIFMLFILGLFLEPRLLGLARIEQTGFSEELLTNTWIYSKTQNESLANIEIAVRNYPSYFSSGYLFITGDQNTRNSVKVFGEFYKIDALFLIVGVLGLLFLRSKVTLLIFGWVLLAPIPSALSSLTPNATRAMYMLGSMHLVSAYGATTIIKLLKNRHVQVLATSVFIIILGYEFYGYIKYYFNEYPKKDATEWQYGMKQVVEYAKTNPGYDKLYMDKIRQQPYIFFLFYLQTPLPEFLETVKYDESESKSYNTVLSFGRHQFGGWDPIESYPIYKILYIVTPSYYGGLRHRDLFMVNKLVKYPDGADAFYIVSGNEP